MKEKYKHLLNFVANVLTLAMEAVCFGWVWYEIYVPQLNKANKFSMRGNWAVIGMYVLFVFFFTKVLGGYRIGYMRLSDIVLSQVLAVLLAMVVSYFEVCMVANDYMNPRPLLLMTLTVMLWSMNASYCALGLPGTEVLPMAVSAETDARYIWKLFTG